MTRDDIAKALSPKSLRDGVSNETIDQLIFKVRKKLRENNIPKEIKTIADRGYTMLVWPFF